MNRLIDTTFFNSIIEVFSFNYTIYSKSGVEINELGIQQIKYDKYNISGSLQSEGRTVNRSDKGNTQSETYKFYCKSKYRIDVDDVIKYKNKWLLVNSVQEYDEYGVRECICELTNLSLHKDLLEYLKYETGQLTP